MQLRYWWNIIVANHKTIAANMRPKHSAEAEKITRMTYAQNFKKYD